MSEKQEKSEEQVSLDELFQEIETILTQMEDPAVSLEDSFSLYEQGMKKLKDCTSRLDLVEKKMKMLASDGTEVPFE